MQAMLSAGQRTSEPDQETSRRNKSSSSPKVGEGRALRDFKRVRHRDRGTRGNDGGLLRANSGAERKPWTRSAQVATRCSRSFRRNSSAGSPRRPPKHATSPAGAATAGGTAATASTRSFRARGRARSPPANPLQRFEKKHLIGNLGPARLAILPEKERIPWRERRGTRPGRSGRSHPAASSTRRTRRAKGPQDPGWFRRNAPGIFDSSSSAQGVPEGDLRGRSFGVERGRRRERVPARSSRSFCLPDFRDRRSGWGACVRRMRRGRALQASAGAPPTAKNPTRRVANRSGRELVLAAPSRPAKKVSPRFIRDGGRGARDGR